MAIDTANKRRTAYGWGFMPSFLGDAPSGTIGAPARLGVAALYSGIAAALLSVLDLDGKLRALAGHAFSVDEGHEYAVREGFRWRVVELK